MPDPWRSKPRRSFGLGAALVLFCLAVTTAATAETFEAPIGGHAIPLPEGLVACGTSEHGWEVGTDRRTVKPPAAESAVGTDSLLDLAPSEAQCSSSTRQLTLVATAPWPTLDQQSLVFYPDDGRLEMRGSRLRGVHLRWTRGGVSREDVCESGLSPGPPERCTWNIGGELASATGPDLLEWAPAGSRSGVEIVFDADGKPVPSDRFRLGPPRLTTFSVLLPPEAVIDALGETTAIPIRHAEAVAAVDCAPALCAIEGTNLVVGSLPAGTTSLTVRMRLAPHFALRRGDAVESSPGFKIPVLRCPVSIVSGPPLRDIDNQKIVVQVGGRCATEVQHLKFQLSGYQAERVGGVENPSESFVVLRLPQIDADEVTLMATRDDGDAFVVAQVRTRTRAVPAVRVGLELAGGIPVDFVPTNVDAVAVASSPNWDGRLAIVPVDGLYTVHGGPGRTFVRAVSEAIGFVSLRVALRAPNLPTPLADTDLAVVAETSQRAVHEASVPAPLDESAAGGALVDLLCDLGDGRPVLVPPGVLTHVPFDRKDSCRLVLHAERLDPALGTQKLVLDVDVTRVDGSPRSEARISRTLTLAPGKRPRTLWLRGAENRFDRYSIRLSHAADERHYVNTRDSEIGLPAEQWTVITGRGSLRIYATSAIPTGLYRVSDHAHSGLLTLNFGVLARLTWLDSLGREGLLAAEGGVMAVGLANDVTTTGRSLTQVATVVGLGFSVPIANRALATETAINLHAWYEWEPSRAWGGTPGSPSAFVFGPSISIGNIGADL